MADLKVVISGDLTIDWHIARVKRTGFTLSDWQVDSPLKICQRKGGGALLADLTAALAVRLAGQTGQSYTLHQPEIYDPDSNIDPADTNYHHTASIWSQFKGKEKSAWRIEEFLGMTRAETIDPDKWRIDGDDPHADLMLLSDLNLGFRDNPQAWPAAIKTRQSVCPWVILKTTSPVARGPLWEHLLENFAERLIVVMTVDDLRLTEVQVSRELSWERTAQDVYWEVVYNPLINGLSRCAYTVISFGAAGCISLDRQVENGGKRTKCTLVFDPRVMEGMWEQGQPGKVTGYSTCLAGGIAWQILLNPSQPDVMSGITSGLAALRRLHLEGFGNPSVNIREAALVFPTAVIVEELETDGTQFSTAPVQDPMIHMKKGEEINRTSSQQNGYWTILQDRYAGSLEQVASRITLEGPEEALKDVPWGQFGNLMTVDRQEIESFRSIRSLIKEYCQTPNQKKPLSIAVFGAPGSGKSFGIIEVANSIMPGQVEVREVNLSQMRHPDELLAVLHQVRDINLGGKIALVFWDEFDTTLNDAPLGWLRHFLAPMQDGRFQEGQLIHPIGRAIFIFAGGTSASIEGFGKNLDENRFRQAKGPDFVSRLKGFVNILGPDPVVKQGQGSADPYFIIRRALVLRSLFKRNTPALFQKVKSKELLNIDAGVLHALLTIPSYKHGIRSIESIIAMSQLTGISRFERSSLPAEAQLNLHVDGRRFLSLVQQLQLEGAMLEDMARAAHEAYCQGLTARGYTPGPATDYDKKVHYLLVPFDELPEHFKEQNRLNVKDIPAKLLKAGYIMIPARSNEPPYNFPGEVLEELAMAEHERWMASKVSEGWQYASERDDARKLNPCIVPWDDLDQDKKESDRVMVRNIPNILSRAGFTVIRAVQE